MKKNKQNKNVWKNFLRFFAHVRVPWWLYVISMGCGLLTTFITLRLNAFTIAFNKGELYNKVLLGYAGWTLLSMLAVIVLNMTAAYGNEKVNYRGRGALWNKILRLPMGAFQKDAPYSMVASVTEELPNAASAINVLSLFFASTYGFVAAVIVLVQFNATMFTYMLTLIPLAVLQFFINGKLQFYMTKRNYRALNDMTAFFAEHLKCARQVKANAMEEEEINAGLKVIDERFKADLIYGMLSCVQTLINSVYQTLYTVFIAVFGAKLIGSGKMSSDGILTFKTYWSTQDKYLCELLTQYQMIKGSQGATEKVCRLLESEEEMINKNPDVLFYPADIVLDHVSFGYREERRILQDISCTIPYGKTVALIGGNGSGKTTLFKLLLGLYQPETGSIRMAGQEDLQQNLQSWRKQFGYVSQSASLFSGTIRDNLQYGIKDALSEEQIRMVCEKTNLQDYLEVAEHGVDTEVGDAGCRLSGGQRQRIAIARALANDRPYLMLDEATSQLDVWNDRTIEKRLNEHMRGRGVLYIAHNMDSACRADFIILLDRGKIIDTGCHSELMERCALYRELVQIQKGDGKDE